MKTIYSTQRIHGDPMVRHATPRARFIRGGIPRGVYVNPNSLGKIGARKFRPGSKGKGRKGRKNVHRNQRRSDHLGPSNSPKVGARNPQAPKAFKCPTCGKGFGSVAAVAQHRHVLHGDITVIPQGMSTCPKCKVFLKAANLDRHMRAIHGGTDPSQVVYGLSGDRRGDWRTGGGLRRAGPLSPMRPKQ